jgi:hypothetical protein
MTQVYNGSPSQGHSGPGPAFVAAAPAVAAHPGPEQHGARLARPGLRRCHPRRRGASRAGAARGLAGPARPSSPPPPPSRRIPGRSRPLPGRPCRSAVAAHPGRLARPGLRRRRPRPRGTTRAGPEPPGARLVRPGLIVRPGLLLLTLRFVIRCAIASSVWANGRTQQDRASGEGAGAAGSRGSLALSGRERREAEQGVTRSLTSLSRHAS